MNKEQEEKTAQVFNKFAEHIANVARAGQREDEEEIGKSAAIFAEFFAEFYSRMLAYETLLELIAKKSTSLKNKALIARILAPDDSEEVEAFMGFINKNKL